MKIPRGKKSQLCKVIVTSSVFALFCTAAQAQPQPHRPMGRPPSGPPHGPPSGSSIPERWMRMSPEERNVMRQRENLRRETIKRETEAALRESGLRLNPQERAVFESRYIQERRKVEQALRHQIEAERQQQLPGLIQQLKKEFQIDQPARSPATKPAESPNPKK